MPGIVPPLLFVLLTWQSVATAQDLDLVSASPSGLPGNDFSRDASASDHGRYVAFTSWASNLVPGDVNAAADVFVLDRRSGTVEKVSVSSSEQPGDSASWDPSISADGRFVAFTSSSANLVAGDSNGREDVFLRDRFLGTTVRVSVSSIESQAAGGATEGSLSADGCFVAFFSYSTNLVAGDTNERADVFVHDRSMGSTLRASLGAGGLQGGDHSFLPAISADGSTLAFYSGSVFDAGDTNGTSDIYLYDCGSGSLEQLRAAAGGAQCNGWSGVPSLSGDGNRVAFESFASNLVPGDDGLYTDVFVYDRTTQETVRPSVATDGSSPSGQSDGAAISLDGRFVAFESDAPDLIVNDINGVTDVFVAGPELILDAEPRVVDSGDQLLLTTFSGVPGNAAMLFLASVQGSPHFLPLFSGSFAAGGQFDLQVVVPADPALPGLCLGFQSFALGSTGSIIASQIREVAFE